MIMFGNSYHKVCQNCGRAHSGRITEQFRDGDGKVHGPMSKNSFDLMRR